MTSTGGEALKPDEDRDTADCRKADDAAAGPPYDVAEKPSIWDRAGMMDRLMGDEDLAEKVLQGFLMDIPEQIAVLMRFLEAGDASGTRRQAHTIKGASANVGGERLVAVAFEMEKAARDGDMPAARKRMGDLVRDFEQLRKSVQDGQ